jgi:NADPH2:quinone reductase
VDAVGPFVTGWARGDRVAAVMGAGGLADYAIARAEALVRLPDAMDFDVAAGFQIAYGTSHLALTQAGLAPGETLLVTGAAGGVGLTAVEVGHLMGARVVAIARGAGRLAVAGAAGADHLFDADLPDLRDRIRDLGGADVAYDPVGGDSFTLSLRSLKPGGRLLVIGFASGTVPQIPANHLLVKNVTVIGFWWGGYQTFRPHALADSMATLLLWHAGGRLSPHVGHRFPIESAADGLSLLRSRQATGKVVVTIG